MKRLIITEEEKQRILEMHQSATKRNYLSEQTAQPAASNIKRTFVLNNEPNEFLWAYTCNRWYSPVIE